MNDIRTFGTALKARRARRDARENARAARAQLARDLAAFETQSELLDLAATLDRHNDTQAAPVRDIVDWTRAA